MFVGHFALGFAAKKLVPRTSLATLIAAPTFLDLLWPIFLVLGWESVRIAPGDTAFMPMAFDSYPWSHSLAMTFGWALVFGGAYYAATRQARGALVLGALVVSHWLLDALSHRPDMPLWPGDSPKVGWGLWNSLAGTYLVELGLFAVGVAVYVAGSRPRDRIGVWGLWSFVALLLVLYLVGPFLPPPPSPRVIAAQLVPALLSLVWIAWFDRHREWTWK